MEHSRVTDNLSVVVVKFWDTMEMAVLVFYTVVTVVMVTGVIFIRVTTLPSKREVVFFMFISEVMVRISSCSTYSDREDTFRNVQLVVFGSHDNSVVSCT